MKKRTIQVLETFVPQPDIWGSWHSGGATLAWKDSRRKETKRAKKKKRLAHMGERGGGDPNKEIRRVYGGMGKGVSLGKRDRMTKGSPYGEKKKTGKTRKRTAVEEPVDD